jgi:hypothetical protein
MLASASCPMFAAEFGLAHLEVLPDSLSSPAINKGSIYKYVFFRAYSATQPAFFLVGAWSFFQVMKSNHSNRYS